MRELWNDFWTNRSAAVRGLRVILVVAGAIFAAITPALGLPVAWSIGIGTGISAIAAAITGRDPVASEGGE